MVGLITASSRLLGYVRDVLIANLGGAGPATDAFFVAFRLPNLLRRLFAEGAFSQAFVPVIAEYRARRSAEAVRALVASAAGSLGLIVLLVTLVGVVAAPVVVWASRRGLSRTRSASGWPRRCCGSPFPTCCSCPSRRSRAAC